METIQFDSGIKTYQLGGAGQLRFNPSDPNLYARFLEAAEKIRNVEQDLQTQAQALEGEDAGTAAVVLMQKADSTMKQLLRWVFGQHNDFDQILAGVNLLAVAENGERIITNLFAALQPILVDGAKRCAGEQIRAAVQKAETRRKNQC